MVFLLYRRVSGKEGSEHLFYGRHFPNTIIIREQLLLCFLATPDNRQYFYAVGSTFHYLCTNLFLKFDILTKCP